MGHATGENNLNDALRLAFGARCFVAFNSDAALRLQNIAKGKTEPPQHSDLDKTATAKAGGVNGAGTNGGGFHKIFRDYTVQRRKADTRVTREAG